MGFDVKKFLGLYPVKVLAGDLVPGSYKYEDGVLSSVDDPTDILDLNAFLVSLQKETENDAKNWLLACGSAAAGMLLMGPLIAIFLFLGLGNAKKVCVAVNYKKDDKDCQFLAILNEDVYEDLLTITYRKAHKERQDNKFQY